MITVDLDQDSYDLIRRVVVRRIERGAATTVTEREWAAIQAAKQVGREQRLSMGRQEAESLCDWFEKTFCRGCTRRQVAECGRCSRRRT